MFLLFKANRTNFVKIKNEEHYVRERDKNFQQSHKKLKMIYHCWNESKDFNKRNILETKQTPRVKKNI